MIDTLFVNSDAILYVADERFERFDEIELKILVRQNICVDVAERIDEANCEISEQEIADFSMILHRDSDAKTRKSKSLEIIDFRA